MNNTLIVFASEHGTVEKCARELFRLIDGKVDICDLSQRQIIPDLTGYDSIIIGGSIHYGEIQKAISDFCKTNLDLLDKKRIGLFINCIYTGDKAMLQLNNAFPKELNDKAVVRDYFGGEINDLKLNYFERFITKQIIKKENLVVSLSREKIVQFAKVISNHETKE